MFTEEWNRETNNQIDHLQLLRGHANHLVVSKEDLQSRRPSWFTHLRKFSCINRLRLDDWSSDSGDGIDGHANGGSLTERRDMHSDEVKRILMVLKQNLKCVDGKRCTVNRIQDDAG